ncbi:hypothetical protein RSOLAG1IB_12116 [Rhizoctonia solani AG-1 IB]|uniref:NACHT domain-containing protein n=1 Tax=Thanatephorus cucumeris (strain AG1-IB / isolate 7/3/14) TaxID=1108050 RepID=A0A0B7FI14_THACB|nr:hypothetical protein RSOLAG1IB_12116 [Rhizoctonia solani AG-1 IB]
MNIRKAFPHLGSTPRKKPRIGEGEASPSASTPGSRASSVPPPESVGHTSGSSTPTQQEAPMINSGRSAPVDSTSGNSPGGRAKIRTLLTALESSARVIPPVASAIKTLRTFVDNCGENNEYEPLRLTLNQLLDDLVEHKKTSEEKGTRMSKSVQGIYSDIEAEARNLKSIQRQNTERQLTDALTRLEKITQCYRRIDDHLKRLTLNANLEVLDAVTEQAVEARLNRMSPSMSATYNSAESADVQRRSCTPGTREPQIQSLLEWARDPGAGRTYWMNGMAGTGKTTITHSVCTELDKTGELGASFFCSRTIPECRQVKYIIPSIAYQLARFSHGFRDELVKALKSDPDACSRAPKIQHENLIAGPLAAAQAYLPPTFVVVIDALDECENDDAVGQVLDLLLSSPNTLPVRYLVSSRPEPEIYDRMVRRAGARLVLHDLEPASVQMDIEAYVRDELKDIPLTESQWKAILLRPQNEELERSSTCHYPIIIHSHGTRRSEDDQWTLLDHTHECL